MAACAESTGVVAGCAQTTMETEENMLPILKFKAEILCAIRDHSVTIIQAETGAGKSTQVPQFLMWLLRQVALCWRIVVTQPRRLAAYTLAKRVAQEMGCELGGVVGYRTGYEQCTSPETQLLFCTDGLQLVRELSGHGQAQILVIDEVHEMSINIETLLAWTRNKRAEGWPVKIVLMSATMDAGKLADYYGGDVAVVTVPGKTFPVEERLAHPNELIPVVKNFVSEGRNVLVFQPGKKEIEATISALEGIGAVVLPLHADIEPEEQSKCFDSYRVPKVIVATNIAQTSVTVPDLDCVVDSGMERRVELADGIEGLYLKMVSQADCQQRKGRAGRTKEGVYVLCGGEMSKRPPYCQAEIERTRLDQLVLRLAAVGVDATEVEFFHQPDPAVLKDAKRALHALGAMTAEGQVTEIGRLMARLPLSVSFSRMIVEAERLKCVDDVVTIAAILEVGGLRDRSGKWRTLTKEKTSDLLAELDVWNAGNGKTNDELVDLGIFPKSYWKAKALRTKVARMLAERIVFDNIGASRQNVLLACVSGMVDHLYRWADGKYLNGDQMGRQKAGGSVVAGAPQWVVGLPRDIQYAGRNGRFITRHIVSMISAVNPDWLADVAPQLVTQRARAGARYDKYLGVVSTIEILFNGQVVRRQEVKSPSHPNAAQLFAEYLSGVRAA